MAIKKRRIDKFCDLIAKSAAIQRETNALNNSKKHWIESVARINGTESVLDLPGKPDPFCPSFAEALSESTSDKVHLLLGMIEDQGVFDREAWLSLYARKTSPEQTPADFGFGRRDARTPRDETVLWIEARKPNGFDPSDESVGFNGFKSPKEWSLSISSGSSNRSDASPQNPKASKTPWIGRGASIPDTVKSLKWREFGGLLQQDTVLHVGEDIGKRSKKHVSTSEIFDLLIPLAPSHQKQAFKQLERHGNLNRADWLLFWNKAIDETVSKRSGPGALLFLMMERKPDGFDPAMNPEAFEKLQTASNSSMARYALSHQGSEEFDRHIQEVRDWNILGASMSEVPESIAASIRAELLKSHAMLLAQSAVLLDVYRSEQCEQNPTLLSESYRAYLDISDECSKSERNIESAFSSAPIGSFAGDLDWMLLEKTSRDFLLGLSSGDAPSDSDDRDEPLPHDPLAFKRHHLAYGIGKTAAILSSWSANPDEKIRKFADASHSEDTHSISEQDPSCASSSDQERTSLKTQKLFNAEAVREAVRNQDLDPASWRHAINADNMEDLASISSTLRSIESGAVVFEYDDIASLAPMAKASLQSSLMHLMSDQCRRRVFFEACKNDEWKPAPFISNEWFLKSIAPTKENPPVVDETGRDALFWITVNGSGPVDAAIVKAAIKIGFNPDVTDAKGHKAVFHSVLADNHSIVDAIREAAPETFVPRPHSLSPSDFHVPDENPSDPNLPYEPYDPHDFHNNAARRREYHKKTKSTNDARRIGRDHPLGTLITDSENIEILRQYVEKAKWLEHWNDKDDSISIAANGIASLRSISRRESEQLDLIRAAISTHSKADRAYAVELALEIVENRIRDHEASFLIPGVVQNPSSIKDLETVNLVSRSLERASRELGSSDFHEEMVSLVNGVHRRFLSAAEKCKSLVDKDETDKASFAFRTILKTASKLGCPTDDLRDCLRLCDDLANQRKANSLLSSPLEKHSGDESYAAGKLLLKSMTNQALSFIIGSTSDSNRFLSIKTKAEQGDWEFLASVASNLSEAPLPGSRQNRDGALAAIDSILDDAPFETPLPRMAELIRTKARTMLDRKDADTRIRVSSQISTDALFLAFESYAEDDLLQLEAKGFKRIGNSEEDSEIKLGIAPKGRRGIGIPLLNSSWSFSNGIWKSRISRGLVVSKIIEGQEVIYLSLRGTSWNDDANGFKSFKRIISTALIIRDYLSIKNHGERARPIVEEVAELAKARGAKLILCGHSMGGSAVETLMQTCPEAHAAFVCGSPGTGTFANVAISLCDVGLRYLRSFTHQQHSTDTRIDHVPAAIKDPRVVAIKHGADPVPILGGHAGYRSTVSTVFEGNFFKESPMETSTSYGLLAQKPYDDNDKKKGRLPQFFRICSKYAEIARESPAYPVVYSVVALVVAMAVLSPKKTHIYSIMDGILQSIKTLNKLKKGLPTHTSGGYVNTMQAVADEGMRLGAISSIKEDIIDDFKLRGIEALNRSASALSFIGYPSPPSDEPSSSISVESSISKPHETVLDKLRSLWGAGNFRGCIALEPTVSHILEKNNQEIPDSLRRFFVIANSLSKNESVPDEPQTNLQTPPAKRRSIA